MGKIVLVRHGQSQSNLEVRFTGWNDVSITSLGIKQARCVGKVLNDIRFEMAFTSELKRSKESLTLMLEEMGQSVLPVHSNKALNERDCGYLSGLNKVEAAQKYGEDQLAIWKCQPYAKLPGGESFSDTAARVLPYFKEKILPEARKSKNVIVCSHLFTTRAITMGLEALTLEEALGTEVPKGPTIYEIGPAGKVLSKTSLPLSGLE